MFFFFFISGRDIADELVRLVLVAEIIKNANLMCISFSVKYPHIFGESSLSSSNMTRTIANMYICLPFTSQLIQLMMKT